MSVSFSKYWLGARPRERSVLFTQSSDCGVTRFVGESWCRVVAAVGSVHLVGRVVLEACRYDDLVLRILVGPEDHVAVDVQAVRVDRPSEYPPVCHRRVFEAQ